MKATILLAEDEASIADMLRFNLEKDGFTVIAESNGEEALYTAQEYKPDLAILDWMMPGMTGVEVCRALRQDDNTKHIPVIMLTARGEEADKLKGLDSGADDYVVKPFSPKELIARIHAILRRSRPALESSSLAHNDLVINLDGHDVRYKDKKITVGHKEFQLLTNLAERPGQVFTREQLLDNVWGMESDVEIRTVDVHIARLRKAMDDAHGGLGKMITTVRSVGYKLD